MLSMKSQTTHLNSRLATAAVSLLLVWSVLLYAGWIWSPDSEFVSDFPEEMQLARLGSGGHRDGAKRILVVIGTRPEAIKMAPVIRELRSRPSFSPILVSTGQHAEMLNQVLDAFELQSSVDIELNLMLPNQTLGHITRQVLDQLGRLLSALNPDMVLVQGDTTTAFATALAAFYEKIPIGHIEAGLRTKDIYSPFPEEFNRVAIADIATYHFAATRWAASNLANEGRPLQHVYVTGNTVVDALQYVLKQAHPSPNLSLLLERARGLGSKLVLLTAHRRESHGTPLQRIIVAIAQALERHPDLVIVYPVHLNPNVRASIEAALGAGVVDRLFRDDDDDLGHLRRLVLTTPLSYTDMTLLLSAADFVLTDSGGVQEEAVSLNKPTLVLRDNTERPEGVQVGVAVLVGSNETSILDRVNALMTSPSPNTTDVKSTIQVYGDGHAAQKIVDILEVSLTGSSSLNATAPFRPRPTLVMALTVWRRDMLDQQLQMIRSQEGLDDFRLKIVVFQNGAHVNVTESVLKWNRSEVWLPRTDVELHHIQSMVETGYYGRFLAPLSVEAADDDYFMLFDDDILWGKRYLWNMLRLVNDGIFATRNGRFINRDYSETAGCSAQGWDKSDVWFDDDVQYDFGGHIWAGRMGWLRVAWRYPPPMFANNEDFWISAVLKTKLGISTMKPRCPKPQNGHGAPDLCACSAMIALQHVDGEIGADKTSWDERWRSVEMFVKAFDYKLLAVERPELVQRECDVHHFDNTKSVWDVKGTFFEDCFGWS